MRFKACRVQYEAANLEMMLRGEARAVCVVCKSALPESEERKVIKSDDSWVKVRE